MAALPIFRAIQDSPLGVAISQSTWMFPTIETVHVIALSIVLGSIVVVDLRLVGLASKDRSVTALTNEFLPWTWAAFILAAISGSLLFTSRAADYMNIAAFPAKFVFMAIAGLNMLYFHFVTQKSIGQWDDGEPAPAAKIAGAVSLVMWALVVICARQVGFHL
jgi:hypothetical protein